MSKNSAELLLSSPARVEYRPKTIEIFTPRAVVLWGGRGGDVARYCCRPRLSSTRRRCYTSVWDIPSWDLDWDAGKDAFGSLGNVRLVKVITIVVFVVIIISMVS